MANGRLIALSLVGVAAVSGVAWMMRSPDAPVAPRLDLAEPSVTDPDGARAVTAERTSQPLAAPTERTSVEPPADSVSGCRVEGTVTDANGAPVPDASVWLSDRFLTATGAVVTHTDAAGTFAVDRVLGPRCLSAWAPGWMAAQPRAVFADAGDRVRIDLVLEHAAGTVSGEVVDTADQPVPGAEVWIGRHVEVESELRRLAKRQDRSLLQYSMEPPPIRLVTDARGRFETASAPFHMGEWPLFVRAPGFALFRREVRVDPKKPLHVLVVLHRPATIVGTVVDEAGQPHAGIEVAAGQRRRGDPRWSARQTLTGVDGAFRIEDVTPGDVAMRATHVALGVATATITVVGGEEAVWHAQLDAGLRIRGRVLTESGEPVADLMVSAQPARGFRRAARPHQTATDANGRFELIRCSDAEYRLYVVEQLSSVRTTVVYREDVRPGPAELVFTVLESKIPSVFFTGELRAPDGELTSGRVGLSWCDGASGKSGGGLGVDGRFRLGPLPAGRYAIRFHRKDHATIRRGPLEVAPRQTVDLGRLQFEAWGTLPLLVSDPNGAPLTSTARAQLEPMSHAGRTELELTDQLGRFEKVVPGEYWLRIWSPEHPPAQRKVTVAPGGNPTVAIALASGIAQRFVIEHSAPFLWNRATLIWKTADGHVLYAERARDLLRAAGRRLSDSKPVPFERRFQPGHYVLSIARELRDLELLMDRPAPESTDTPFEVTADSTTPAVQVALPRR